MGFNDLLSSLTPPRRRLVQIMQDINFGRIEELQITNHQPGFDPPPIIVREIKCGGDNSPRAERKLPDFALRQKLVDLFDLFDQTESSTIPLITIKHGLPFEVHVVKENN